MDYLENCRFCLKIIDTIEKATLTKAIETQYFNLTQLKVRIFEIINLKSK